MWRRVPVLLGVLALSLMLPAVPAQATFPDQNGRIAFRRFLNEDRSWGAVFTINPDGTDERQVTFPDDGFVDRNPDVSPDGRRIAFEREGADYDEVFVVDVDGSNLTWLTRHAPDQFCLEFSGHCSGSPAWTPDGRHIVFTSAEGPPVDGFVELQALFIMRADGSHVRQLTQLTTPRLGEDSDPQVSPDGRRIVFQRHNVRGAQPDDGIALWILNLRTGRERRITRFELGGGDTPDWSPDGKRILFHSNAALEDGVSANLYTVRPNGRGLTQLTFEEGGDVNYLGSSYSPDGRFIVVGKRPATGGVNADIFLMRADGSGIHPLTQTVLYDSYPDWGPRLHAQAHH
jgi:TolB protein